MRWRQGAIVAGIAAALSDGGAMAATIDDFVGRWQGIELEISGDAPDLALEPGHLDFEIGRKDGGFRISWTGLGRADNGLRPQTVEADFVPTERPGVFAYDPGSPSLLGRLFADPSTGNPLEGDTLLWARLEGETLTVYGLSIGSDGGFELERYARTLDDGGIAVRYTHRAENDRVVTVEGRLAAAGG